jgi:DNA end-binding protein Ku
MGREAFAVIRDAMSGKALAGMGHVVLSSRERPVIVEPTGKGIRCFTLRYTHEVRNDVEYFAEIPELILPKEMVGLAKRILEAMKGDFDPRYLEDRYRTALISVLEEKQRSTSKPIGPATLSRENVVDLMDVPPTSKDPNAVPYGSLKTRITRAKLGELRCDGDAWLAGSKTRLDE